MRGVLTLAGEGTRILPWSRGLRKEFLPLYDVGTEGAPVLKPVAHLVLETLVGAGLSDITLVVGAKDLAFVRNYFTVDREFLRRHAHHADRLNETERFYRTLSRLRLRFAVQPAPDGFGDAVLHAEPHVGAEPFVLHAGDGLLFEPTRGGIVRRMALLREDEDLDAVLLVRRVPNPSRYGVVEGTFSGTIDSMRKIRVTAMQEKPARPRSPWAATAVYCFSSRLFDALRVEQRASANRELEVTDGIRNLIDARDSVAALIINPVRAEWRSVGSPEGFLAALQRTHSRAGRWRTRHAVRRRR